MSGDFVWAIKNGDLEQVKDIIEKKVLDFKYFQLSLKIHINESLFLQSVNVNEEVDGRPLILYAADYGQADVIDYLITAGADVNVNIIKICNKTYIFNDFFHFSSKINMG